MKHRSIHIFILVAAALVAAPQASEELSSWRDAAGRRVKTVIFSAFLSLQAGDVVRPAAPQAPASLLASDCESAEGEARPARRERPATRVEVHARREVPADVAMLGEPEDLEVAQLDPEPPPADAEDAPAYRFELFDEKGIRAKELAMLTAPDDNEVAEARPAREVAARARVAAQRRRVDEVRQQRAAFVVRLDDADDALQSLSDEELPGSLEALRQFEGDVNMFAPPAPKKARKAKPAPRPAPAPPAARHQCPSRRTSQPACGVSRPELFFISE